MTEIERQILVNQAVIITALAFIIEKVDGESNTQMMLDQLVEATRQIRNTVVESSYGR
ncbi:MAG TPA: hypothetical protein PKD55_02530 [Bellilinea sp.]|nr:hypothetical protein [Bellilinea sp.]